MPSSDYATTGGALKLKGGGIDKKKKKKKPKPDADHANPSSAREGAGAGAGASALEKKDLQALLAEEDAPGASSSDGKEVVARTDGREDIGRDAAKEVAQYRGKTEAERKHEERRRKRLDERLRREGVKTHKERVEELNRYLSNLSEHHDMPRIGPG